MLQQCKLKNEDFDKFKRDQTNASVPEKKKTINRMTIRSSAAKTLEKISGRLPTSLKVFFRKISNPSVFDDQTSTREIPHLKAFLGRKVCSNALV